MFIKYIFNYILQKNIFPIINTGGIFLWHYPRDHSHWQINQHPALWSSDFPHIIIYKISKKFYKTNVNSINNLNTYICLFQIFYIYNL